MAAKWEESSGGGEAGATGAAAELAAALRRQAADTAALMAAEARLAGVSLVAMVNGLILAGLCVLTGWGLLVAAAVWSLAAAGAPLGAVFAGLAVVHIVIGIVLWKLTLRLGRHLEFEATRRQLRIIDGDGSG